MNQTKITILVDDPGSWIQPYALEIIARIEGYSCVLVHKVDDIAEGDILLLLGCTQIIPSEVLKRNKLNLVIHESAVPQGKGWSPLSWQVLEGAKQIPITLLEATEKVDSGKIFAQDIIKLDGSELYEELKAKQGHATQNIFLRFLEKWPEIQGQVQVGSTTYYRKRTHEDDELDTSKSLEELFDHIRICDPEKFPAWFTLRGQRYTLKIEKD